MCLPHMHSYVFCSWLFCLFFFLLLLGSDFDRLEFVTCFYWFDSKISRPVKTEYVFFLILVKDRVCFIVLLYYYYYCYIVLLYYCYYVWFLYFIAHSIFLFVLLIMTAMYDVFFCWNILERFVFCCYFWDIHACLCFVFVLVLIFVFLFLFLFGVLTGAIFPRKTFYFLSKGKWVFLVDINLSFGTINAEKKKIKGIMWVSGKPICTVILLILFFFQSDETALTIKFLW